MSRLGALVVGQSPRPEVEAALRAVLGPDLELDMRGALDGLSRAEIERITPLSDADTLFTRLPSGEGVRISKAAVIENGEYQLADLAAAGSDVTMVLCTGEFAGWMEKYQVVFPSRIMNALVKALLPAGRLGVFTPLEEQQAQSRQRWNAAGYDAAVVALSPNADEVETEAAARDMAAAAPDLLLFDCISYTRETKAIVRRSTGLPGILAITAAARTAAELVS